MQPLTPVFGIGFYILLIAISAVSFFLWRRLFRKILKSEAAVVIATAVASMITTPVLLLALSQVMNTLATQ